MAKKIFAALCIFGMVALNANAQSLMTKVINDGDRSICNLTMAKAQVWRTEERQITATSNLTRTAAEDVNGNIVDVIIVRPYTVYGPLYAVYKDGMSLDVTAGAVYGLDMDSPELMGSLQPTLGASLRYDGIGWANIETHTETVKEVYGYSLGGAFYKEVEPWEIGEDEPTIIYYQMIEGTFVIWFERPEDESYSPKTGRLLTREVTKEVSEVKHNRPFGAELNVSATIRPYEKDSAKPNMAYYSFKTTFYLKYRLWEDKWLRNRLNLYASVGYIHGKDSEQYEGEESPRPYTGSGVTYGAGLEYRYQFPLKINKNGKANYFLAGSALNFKLGIEQNPVVRPGNTDARWMLNASLSFSFGLGRKVKQ